MPGRLRRRTGGSSSDHDTSQYCAEKLALFGEARLAPSQYGQCEGCRNPTCRQNFRPGRGGARIACFNLAFLIGRLLSSASLLPYTFLHCCQRCTIAFSRALRLLTTSSFKASGLQRRKTNISAIQLTCGTWHLRSSVAAARSLCDSNEAWHPARGRPVDNGRAGSGPPLR